MNKKTYTLATLFCLFLISFVACGDDDNTDDYSQWKDWNEALFDNAKAKYTNEVYSQSNNGFVRFNTVDADNSNLKMAPDGTIQFSDSVAVLYEGWYINEDGSKYTFDSSIARNNVPDTMAVSGVIDGWTTVLQTMKEGDEVEMCIPQKLAYGSSGKTNTSGVYVIRPYTTLYFNLKVIEVFPCNPKDFE